MRALSTVTVLKRSLTSNRSCSGPVEPSDRGRTAADELASPTATGRHGLCPRRANSLTDSLLWSASVAVQRTLSLLFPPPVLADPGSDRAEELLNVEARQAPSRPGPAGRTRPTARWLGVRPKHGRPLS